MPDVQPAPAAHQAGAGAVTGPPARVPSPAEMDEAWAEVAALKREFPSGWDFTWAEYPQGWRFVATPWAPLDREPCVISERADHVAAGVRLRETPEGR
jgi:hypothetical protein